MAKVTRSKWLLGLDSVITTQQQHAPQTHNSYAGVYDGSPTPAYDTTGAGYSSWSEPIAARNAYIAWRCTHPKQRQSWCAGLGIMQRRMTSVHSMAREIGHRVASDSPHSAHLVSQLLGSGKEGGDHDGHGSAAWPPPGLFTSDSHLLRVILVASHCGNLVTGESSMRKGGMKQCRVGKLAPHRALQISAKGLPREWISDATAKLAVPSSASTPGQLLQKQYAGTLPRALSMIGLPQRRLLAVHLDNGSATIGIECDGDWMADAALVTAGIYSSPYAEQRHGHGDRCNVGRPGAPGADSAVKVPGPGEPFSSRLPNNVLGLLMGLPAPVEHQQASRPVASGAPPPAAPVPSQAARKGKGASSVSATSADWHSPMSPSQGATRPAAHPTGPSHFDRPTSSSSSSQQLPLALQPLAQALPVTAQALLMMAGPRGNLRLPRPPIDYAQEQAIAAETGVRRMVPGAVYQPPAGRGTGFSVGRSALPMPGMDGADGAGSGYAADSPLEVTVNSMFGTNWKTKDALSGHGAFTADTRGAGGGDEWRGGGDDGQEMGKRGGVSKKLLEKPAQGKGTGGMAAAAPPPASASEPPAPTTYPARPMPNSLIRLLADVQPESSFVASQLAAQQAQQGGGGKKGKAGKGDAYGYEDDGRVPELDVLPSPLLAVCSSLQLQESVTMGGGRSAHPHRSVTAVMSGCTLLWREPTTLALSLLLFGRGVEASLVWQRYQPTTSSYTGIVPKESSYITAVVFDPSSTSSSVPLSPTRISIGMVREVNAIRRQISKVLGGNGGHGQQRGSHGASSSFRPGAVNIRGAAALSAAGMGGGAGGASINDRVMRLLGLLPGQVGPDPALYGDHGVPESSVSSGGAGDDAYVVNRGKGKAGMMDAVMVRDYCPSQLHGAEFDDGDDDRFGTADPSAAWRIASSAFDGGGDDAFDWSGSGADGGIRGGRLVFTGGASTAAASKAKPAPRQSSSGVDEDPSSSSLLSPYRTKDGDAVWFGCPTKTAAGLGTVATSISSSARSKTAAASAAGGGGGASAPGRPARFAVSSGRLVFTGGTGSGAAGYDGDGDDVDPEVEARRAVKAERAAAAAAAIPLPPKSAGRQAVLLAQQKQAMAAAAAQSAAKKQPAPQPPKPAVVAPAPSPQPTGILPLEEAKALLTKATSIHSKAEGGEKHAKAACAKEKAALQTAIEKATACRAKLVATCEAYITSTTGSKSSSSSGSDPKVVKMRVKLARHLLTMNAASIALVIQQARLAAGEASSKAAVAELVTSTSALHAAHACVELSKKQEEVDKAGRTMTTMARQSRGAGDSALETARQKVQMAESGVRMALAALASKRQLAKKEEAAGDVVEAEAGRIKAKSDKIINLLTPVAQKYVEMYKIAKKTGAAASSSSGSNAAMGAGAGADEDFWGAADGDDDVAGSAFAIGGGDGERQLLIGGVDVEALVNSALMTVRDHLGTSKKAPSDIMAAARSIVAGLEPKVKSLLQPSTASPPAASPAAPAVGATTTGSDAKKKAGKKQAMAAR